MRKPVIVDTNVAVVANGRDTHAGIKCVANCANELNTILKTGAVVLDSGREVLGEYIDNLRDSGQPGVGDQFLKWILTNLANPNRCVLVELHPNIASVAGFTEIPDDPELAAFDRSDCKFLALATGHAEHPSIVNATDSDWAIFHTTISRLGVTIKFLCPDECRSPIASRGLYTTHSALNQRTIRARPRYFTPVAFRGRLSNGYRFGTTLQPAS